MLFTPATEFKERVLKTGARTIFSVLSSAIFKSYGLPLHTRSLFSVLPSPFHVPRSTFFVLRSSFPVPGFSNFPSLVALIQWEFFWGLPLNSKWVGKITVFTRFPVITREATWKKNIEKTVYGHFTPWSFRPQSLRSNQKLIISGLNELRWPKRILSRRERAIDAILAARDNFFPRARIDRVSNFLEFW